MKYKVIWKRKASKQTLKFPPKEQQKIQTEVNTLEDSKTWGDVKKLKNHEYEYRLRVGNYRVLFNTAEVKIEENEIIIEINEVSIEEVKKRDNRTY